MRKTIFLTAVAIITMLMSINTMAQTPVSGTVNAVPTPYQVTPTTDSYCAGGSVTIILLNSEGGTIEYQLYRGVTTEGVPKSGTNTSLSWPGMTAGTYTIIATNTLTGCTSLMTGSATITENPLPIFSLQPINSVVCENSNTTFTATATATGGTTYQWQLSTNGGGSWSNLTNTSPYSGTTTTTLSITSVTTAMSAYQYRMVATSPALCSVNSNAAQLTVNAVPIITVQPLSTQYCDGEAAIFSSVDNGTGWQWQLSTNGGGSWSNLTNTSPYSGTTTNTLNVTSVTTAMSAYRYRVIITSLSGCITTSSTAILTVNPLPALFVVSALTTSEYCFGTGGVTIKLSSSVSGVNYELYRDGVTTTNILSGNGGQRLWNNQLEGIYTVEATTVATGCTRMMTGSAIIVENDLPTASDITFSEPCSDEQMEVTVTGLTGSSPWIIQIYNEVSGTPGTIIHTETNISTPNYSYDFLPNWIGTENKYFHITDNKGCENWW